MGNATLTRTLALIPTPFTPNRLHHQHTRSSLPDSQNFINMDAFTGDFGLVANYFSKTLTEIKNTTKRTLDQLQQPPPTGSAPPLQSNKNTANLQQRAPASSAPNAQTLEKNSSLPKQRTADHHPERPIDGITPSLFSRGPQPHTSTQTQHQGRERAPARPAFYDPIRSDGPQPTVTEPERSYVAPQHPTGRLAINNLLQHVGDEPVGTTVPLPPKTFLKWHILVQSYYPSKWTPKH